MIRKIHLWIGIVGLLVFVLSGQYFKLVLDGLQGMENTPRLLLRTSHVYLYLTSVINLVLGFYYIQPAKVRWFTVFNQSLVMLAPFFVGYSFVFETITNPGIDRPFTLIGMVLILAWVINVICGKLYMFFKVNKTLKSQPSATGKPQSGES